MGSMLLVIPFHNGDRGQVERLGKWMNVLSKGKKIGDQILFAATEKADIAGIGDNFKGLFSEIKGIQQTFGPNLQHNEPAWPKACNFQFLHVCKYINEAYPDIDSFYYFEPDNLPLTPDWFDKIQADYKKQGKPFYGASASYVMRADGATWEDGQHMIGTGIYPRNAWARVKGYEQIERNQPGRPWDALTRDEVNPMCHFTDLIQNVHSSRGFRDNDGLTAVYRPNMENEFLRREVPISHKAVIFHGCKDASLRLIVAKRLGIEQNDRLTFCHAGDLGDIIYALPSIKAYGGGVLKFSDNGYAREQMTDARIDLIAPLLFEQKYIHSVARHEGEYVDFDFRDFRVLHKQHSNLSVDQAEWTGAVIDTVNPWLEVDQVEKSSHVIINRTERYRNSKFPWATIHRKLATYLRLIGLPKEHAEFEDTFGTTAYVATQDLLQVAKLIAGCNTFIGNQSVCYSISEGLKHKRIQETCEDAMDCIYNGEGGTYYIDGKLELPEIEDSRPETIPDIDQLQLENLIRQIVKEEIELAFK